MTGEWTIHFQHCPPPRRSHTPHSKTRRACMRDSDASDTGGIPHQSVVIPTRACRGTFDGARSSIGTMSYDYDVVLTRKDGSVRNFRIYGQSTPNGGDIITLPVHGW